MAADEPPEPSTGASRIQTTRARVEAWRLAAQRRVEISRTQSRGVDAAFVVEARDRAVGGNLLASAIAYRLFLWLLPFSLLVAAALGFARAAGDTEPEQLGEDVGLGRSAIVVVADAASQAERSRVILLLLALFGLYVAGAAGAKTLVAVHRFAWGMSPSRPRAGIAASLAFTGCVLAVLALSLGAEFLRSRSPGFGLTANLVVGLAFAALWLGITLLLPHADASWIRLVPGALFLGLGMQVLHLVSVYYLSNKIESASELYGGLGFSATLLLGLYFLARLAVAAAVLNATLWERSTRHGVDVVAHPEGGPPATDAPSATTEPGSGQRWAG